MNAPAFPINPFVGQHWQNWTWNGGMWVVAPATGVQVLTRVFAASGTYLPSPGLVTAVVECIGGGGGGGAVEANVPVLYIVGGAGGGSGGYARKTIPAALLLGGAIVTIGVGGVSNANGTATSFGALCVANGGFGANVNNPGFGGVAGGGGGQPGIGDYAPAGACGDNGYIIQLTTAGGNSAPSSKGGQVYGGNVTGEAGPHASSNGPVGYANSGAGGGGAIVNQVTGLPLQIGGVGGSGVCIVTEYCWADVIPEPCPPCPPGGGARVPLGFCEEG